MTARNQLRREAQVGQVLQVGAPAPALHLPDSTSALYSLGVACARQPQVLLFFRGHW